MFDSLVFGVKVVNADITSGTLIFHTVGKGSQNSTSIRLTIKAEMTSAGLENWSDSVVADN